jgi:prepilin-type N-terminal cleavage/methylation domain-containing protein
MGQIGGDVASLDRTRSVVEMRRSHAFTLLEVMAVIAVVGIFAAMAMPSLVEMTRGYRGNEAARQTLAYLSEARARSQRNNAPVQLTIKHTASPAPGVSVIELRDAVVDSGTVPLDQVTTVRRNIKFPTAASVTHVTDTRFVEIVVGGVATPATSSPTLIFCPTTDGYFRLGATNVAACSVGDLASASASVRFRFGSKLYFAKVTSAIGQLELRSGNP